MSFLEKGYLSADLESWPGKVRASFPTYSRLAREMSELCQCTIHQMADKLPRSDAKNPLAIAATMRMAEFLQSAIVLIERGMIVSARNSLRSGFETAFFLAGLVELPDFVQRAIVEDTFQSEKMYRARIRVLQRYQFDDPSTLIAGYEKMIEELRQRPGVPEGKLKGWNLQEIADKGGLGDVYETFYRLLSTDAAHAVFTAMSDMFDGPDALQYGPGTGDYFDTFNLLMALGDCGLTQCNVLLKSDSLRTRLDDLHKQTAEFEVKQLEAMTRAKTE